jgi:hypothetical protein
VVWFYAKLTIIELHVPALSAADLAVDEVVAVASRERTQAYRGQAHHRRPCHILQDASCQEEEAKTTNCSSQETMQQIHAANPARPALGTKLGRAAPPVELGIWVLIEESDPFVYGFHGRVESFPERLACQIFTQVNRMPCWYFIQILQFE